MSDAPRLKAMLKAAMLDWEVKHPPTTLKDVAQRAVRYLLVSVAARWLLYPAEMLNAPGVDVQASPDLMRGPPTTVIEAIFLLFQEASVSSLNPSSRVRNGAKSVRSPPPSQWVSEKYFPEGFDLWDIFFPSE